LADALPGGVDGSLGGLAQEGFEFGEELLDRIEVGTVRGEEEEFGPCGADGATDGRAFVASEIVHDDDVAWVEGGHEDLLDIGGEAAPVDRAVDDARRVDAVAAQGGQEGERPPFAVGRLGDQPAAARPPAPKRRHVGLGPRLVDEDQTPRIEVRLAVKPGLPLAQDVGTVLLGRVGCLFLRVMR